MAKKKLLALCAFAASVAAQNVVVLPASHATREGTTSTNVPFGRSSAVRAQHVYDAMLFAGPANITGLSFRIDGMVTASQKTVDCEIRMSTSPRTLVQTSPTFAQNRGLNEVVVLLLPFDVSFFGCQVAWFLGDSYLAIEAETPSILEQELYG